MASMATLHLMAGAPEKADPYLQRIREADPAAAHEIVADVRISADVTVDGARDVVAYARAERLEAGALPPVDDVALLAEHDVVDQARGPGIVRRRPGQIDPGQFAVDRKSGV